MEKSRRASIDMPCLLLIVSYSICFWFGCAIIMRLILVIWPVHVCINSYDRYKQQPFEFVWAQKTFISTHVKCCFDIFSCVLCCGRWIFFSFSCSIFGSFLQSNSIQDRWIYVCMSINRISIWFLARLNGYYQLRLSYAPIYSMETIGGYFTA